MGAADSRLLQQEADKITRVSSQTQNVALDPCLERLQSLKPAGPLLTASSAESGLKEIILEQRSSLKQSCIEELSLDPAATADLFALYQEWQKENINAVSQRQEDLGYRIEAVEALALKLLQRLTHSASVMKTTASHLEEVEKLQNEVADMKKTLASALESYETLCNTINESGNETLKGSLKIES